MTCIQPPAVRVNAAAPAANPGTDPVDRLSHGHERVAPAATHVKAE
jgi:hypothetical protein